MVSFTHLHVHSEYSLMESAITIENLIKTASRLNMESVALTDKYMMGGAIEFYNKALSANIKPIIGCEICLSDRDGLFHLILLAKDAVGYGNLCRIVSRSHLEQKFPIPSVDIQYLREKSGGLIGLSGCINGKIPYLLRKDSKDKALTAVSKYLDIFRGDFYIEIQRGPSSRTSSSYNNISEIIASFAVSNGLPLVASNNVHYIDPDSYDAYRYLFKLKSMGTKNDPLARIIMGRENYFKSAEQMASMFRDIPDAISNTSIISGRCNLDMGSKKIYLPHFKVPEGETEASWLKRLCRMGLGWRSGHYPSPEYFSRLEKELSIIEETGFSGYFLIIADIARFTRTKNIPICGKGSAAGSLVSYLLGISNVDPVKHGLYFERFLNPGRKEPPDIDIDICSKRRGEVLDYLSSKYGRDSVSRVCSLSTIRPRAAIREAGRIMGLGKYDIDNIVRNAGGFTGFSSRRSSLKNRKELEQHIDGDRLSRSVLAIARKIENHIRHLSMHPSAFIISCRDLTGMVPLTLSKTGEIMTQYDMDSIEKLGLIKTDLIGSISLSLISDVVKSLKKQRNIDIDISEINYDDERVFDIIKNGRTHCVFQLESSGIRSLAKKLKPSSLNDITLLISLYRPGPQQSGMVKNFIERKFGREDITFIHRDLEPILRDTYGVILYQEQVMKIALKIANYSLSEADILRKAITRLSSLEMGRQKSKFLKGSFQNGYPLDIAHSIFDLISKFASYGFVKAHAAAYSEISYKIAYLKVYFPAELISAILSNKSGYYGQAQYIEEARRLGLTLRLPDINKSGLYFAPEDNGKSIRIPLTSIRDLGFSGADSIIKERVENGSFKDLIDFYFRCRRNCPLSKNAIENLIKIGGFDCTGLNRSSLLSIFYYLRTLKSYTGTLPHTVMNSAFKLSSTRGKAVTEKRLEDESRILGFCISSSLLDYFREEFERFKPCSSRAFPDIINAGRQAYSKDIYCAGTVLNRRIEKTKNSKNMLFCTMEDRDGIFESIFFPDSYQKNIKILLESAILIVKGNLHYRDGDITLIGKEAIDPVFLKKLNKYYKKEALKRDILAESIPLWKS